MRALLKFFATEAKKEVKSVAEAVEANVYNVMAAKDASVIDLKSSAEMLQSKKDDALHNVMIKHQKNTEPFERFEFERGESFRF